MDAFDVDEYEFYERVENGDMNWISNKFLALANPKEELPPNFRPSSAMMSRFGAYPASRFYSVYRINELVKWFKERKIHKIIRLNNKLYDRTKFEQAGVDHVEMYFPDGTTPPEGILLKFLEICETHPGMPCLEEN